MTQFVFGAGQMIGTRNDLVAATPTQVGIFQEVSLDFSGDVKDLFGQYQFPVVAARGKTKIQGKAKFGTVNGLLLNNLMFGQTLTAGAQVLTATNEAQSVPGATAFTITVNNAATFLQDYGVLYASGIPLTYVATTPTVTGTYTVSAGVYTFYSGDASAAVLISYTYSATAAVSTASTPIPGTPYQITPSAAWVSDGGVIFSPSGTVLTKVLSAPTTGQYAVTAGVYTFAAADTTKNVIITYNKLATSGSTIALANLQMGNTPTFGMVFTVSFRGQQFTVTFNQCVSTKLMLATKIDDFMIPELDFEVFADQNNNIGKISLYQ